MTRIAAWTGAALGTLLTLLALFVLPWSQYGGMEIMLDRFTGWQVYAISAVALQAIVAWARFLPARWPQVRLAAGIICGVAAVASAVVLGSRYDNSADFFDPFLPLVMVMPMPGPGPVVAVLAALVNLVDLVPVRTARPPATQILTNVDQY